MGSRLDLGLSRWRSALIQPHLISRLDVTSLHRLGPSQLSIFDMLRVPIANSKTRIRIICLLKLINYIPIDIFTLSYNWIWLFQITKIPLIKCYHWWDNDYDNIIITIIIVISHVNNESLDSLIKLICPVFHNPCNHSMSSAQVFICEMGVFCHYW